MSLYIWLFIRLFVCFSIQTLPHSKHDHFQNNCAIVVNSCNCVYVQCNQSEKQPILEWIPFGSKHYSKHFGLRQKIPQLCVKYAGLPHLTPPPKHPPPLHSALFITCSSHLTRNRSDQGEHMLWPDGALQFVISSLQHHKFPQTACQTECAQSLICISLSTPDFLLATSPFLPWASRSKRWPVRCPPGSSWLGERTCTPGRCVSTCPSGTPGILPVSATLCHGCVLCSLPSQDAGRKKYSERRSVRKLFEICSN